MALNAACESRGGEVRRSGVWRSPRAHVVALALEVPEALAVGLDDGVRRREVPVVLNEDAHLVFVSLVVAARIYSLAS